MAASDARLEALIESLMKIGAVKFGTFTLKSGVTSPIYIDLRVLPSHPPVLNEVMEVINDRLQSEGVKFDLVCGVPYTALPMATLVAVKRNVPMVICRKEEKAYGTKKIVDGVYSEGQSVLIIEDVVTSGISIAQTGENLRKSGLKADTAIVFLNREQGGTDNLHKQGYKLHSVIPISRLLDVLGRKGLLSKERIEEVRHHLSSTVTSIPRAPELPLLQRATMAKSPVAKALFQVMADKSTNIAVAADVSSAEELLRLAEEVGPEICLLKTHVDILDKFDAATRDALVSLAKKHNFLIMEDRKFADIGSVAAKQYAAGPFRIAEWSRLVTVHVIAGEASVAAMTTDAARHQNGVLLIAEMSSAGAGTSEQTVQSALEIAKKHPGLVAGFICQRRLSEDAEAQAFLYCTPGVSLEQTGDGQGQQYNGPEQLVARGTDVLIVGRGIVAQADRKAAAAKYRAAGWQALTKRLAAGHAQA